MKDTAAIVLAAGRGTRIKAKDKNKVTFNLGERPMVQYTIENLQKAGINQIIVVVGFQAESVKKALGSKVNYALQKEPLGTGHAVKFALSHLQANIKTVFLINGDDSAFYTPKLYQQTRKKLVTKKSDIVLLTITKKDPFGLGRIVRSESGTIQKIVEEKVATKAEKEIKEINTNMYCIKRELLDQLIPEIKRNPTSQEYYLTDIIELANQANKKVVPLVLEDPKLWHGVNTRKQLEAAQIKHAKIKSK